MKKLLVAALLSGVLVSGAGTALAKKPVEVDVRTDTVYGPYLATSRGLALYMFSRDVRGHDGRKPVMKCRETCLQIWTPLFTSGMPRAGKGVKSPMIGTLDLGRRHVTTYNGWPLYRYISDNEPGETDGAKSEGFDGHWHLVSPAGKAISLE